jgi:hypothetical protein
MSLMEWTRSETIAMARHSCSQCHGLGLRQGHRERMHPCNCVLRAIFRACYARFRYCVTKEKHLSRVSLEIISGREGRWSWGRKDEEYVADFCLVSRRALTDYEHTIFRYHFLLGADWKLCCRKLKMDRGNFFHSIYRIEQKLGRAFREVQPYPLYPLQDYFHGTMLTEPDRKGPVPSTSTVPLRAARPVFHPPLLKTA